MSAKKYFTYEQLDKHLGSRDERPLAHNTRIFRDKDITNDMIFIGVVYHSTTIARLYPDGSVEIRHGGWQSNTTKDRLNWFTQPIGYTVYQKDWAWYVYNYRTGETFEYENGMVLGGVR